jgi:hypothetical protein
MARDPNICDGLTTNNTVGYNNGADRDRLTGDRAQRAEPTGDLLLAKHMS